MCWTDGNFGEKSTTKKGVNVRETRRRPLSFRILRGLGQRRKRVYGTLIPPEKFFIKENVLQKAGDISQKNGG